MIKRFFIGGLISLGVFALYLPCSAAFTLNTNTATSSNNIVINSIQFDNGLILYKIPDTVSPIWGASGNCHGGSYWHYGTYGCLVYVNVNAVNPVDSFLSTAHLGLTDGNYALLDTDVFGNANSCFTQTLSDCKAAITGVGHTYNEQDFQICADGSCISAPTSTAATSTLPTFALFWADYAVAFYWILGAGLASCFAWSGWTIIRELGRRTKKII